MGAQEDSDTGGNGAEGSDSKTEKVSFLVGNQRVSGQVWRSGAANGSVMVMAHGLGLLVSAGLPPFIERFVAAGVTVLAFDYRHFGESEGEPRQLVDVDHQLEDWRAAIAYATGLSGIDPAKLILWGTSFSGGHVLTVSATLPGVAAVISQVPHVNGPASSAASDTGNVAGLAVSSTADGAQRTVTIPFVGLPGDIALMTQPGTRDAYLALFPRGAPWTNETPARFVLQLPNYSPDSVKRTEQPPVLVVVATDDQVAPAAPAREFANATGARLYEVRGGHFDVYSGPLFGDVITEELTFLRELGLVAK
ncbi:MAG: alpha/beta fold hydrolase [Myxococcales bacterium]